MATKAQAKSAYIKKNERSFLDQVTLAEVQAALDAGQRASLLAAIRAGQASRAGKIMVRGGRIAARNSAATTADSILADDLISLTELDGWL